MRTEPPKKAAELRQKYGGRACGEALRRCEQASRDDTHDYWKKVHLELINNVRP